MISMISTYRKNGGAVVPSAAPFTGAGKLSLFHSAPMQAQKERHCRNVLGGW